MAEPVLEVRGLRRRFGDVQAVDDVSFGVGTGETYGLLGPNGAGKTTTISMVCGLLAADEGTVRVGGEPVSPRTTRVRGRIGYVPQELAVYPDLSGRENLRFFGRIQGMGRRELGERVDHMLDVVGLTERAGDRVDTWSGGMKRRLNIAVGLLHEPELLVLDEPTVGVDPQSRNAILESVEALAGSGMAVLYTTHYMEEAERLCDRVAIMDVGRIEAEGTRRELVARAGGHDRLRIEGRGDLEAAARELRTDPRVVDVTTDDAGMWATVDTAGTHLPRLLGAVDRAGVEVTAVEVREPDLEVVFLQLTGKALRDT